jgi:hypothetical protein
VGLVATEGRVGEPLGAGGSHHGAEGAKAPIAQQYAGVVEELYAEVPAAAII